MLEIEMGNRNWSALRSKKRRYKLLFVPSRGGTMKQYVTLPLLSIMKVSELECSIEQRYNEQL